MIKYAQYFLILFCVALLNSCDKPNDQTVTADSIIRLEAVSTITGVSADGNTILQFKATIPTTTSSDTKDIVFSISDPNFGKFTGTNANTNQTVKSNSEGVALSSVKVGTVPGDYFISAAVTVNGTTYKSADIPVSLAPLSNADKIQLTADNLSPVADAFSIVNFTTHSTFSIDKKVTLTSNMGTFIGSTDPKTIDITLDDQGNFSVPYRISNEVVSNIITATLTDGSSSTIILSPQISYTDTILTDASALHVDTLGGSIDIRSSLRKFNNNYKVSKNTQVYFRAYQIVGTTEIEAGRFTGVNLALSDIDGNAPAVKFFADSGGLIFNAPVYIEVSAYKSATEKAKKVFHVTLVP